MQTAAFSGRNDAAAFRKDAFGVPGARRSDVKLSSRLFLCRSEDSEPAHAGAPGLRYHGQRSTSHLADGSGPGSNGRCELLVDASR